MITTLLITLLSQHRYNTGSLLTVRLLSAHSATIFVVVRVCSWYAERYEKTATATLCS